MHRNQSVNVHQFAMTPRADIPRASFRRQTTYKTTFDAGYLIPFLVDEVLPGDTFNLRATMFGRLATPLFPIVDNLYLDTFYFFVPCRLVWDNWQKFMGEQTNPGDSISFVIPTVESAVGGYPILSIYDYMGLPTVGQVNVLPGGTIVNNSLPLRAYNLIYNEWFRDQNLQDSLDVPRDDGPDVVADFNLKRRGKRHDYFTSCLPFVQKGQAVTIPLGTTAPVVPDDPLVLSPEFQNATGGSVGHLGGIAGGDVFVQNNVGLPSPLFWDDPHLHVDLSTATAATINQLRQSFQIQRLLERDARGGTRYTEIVRSHFGVVSPDSRLQRPEYLGGNSQFIAVNPVSQQSESGGAPLGTQGAFSTVVSRNGFTQSFVEHGYLIGLVSVRADLTYQQGLRRMWSRSTRYDFYFPAFAMLGEQAVLSQEIYASGLPVDDQLVFGYQERWAEYRYFPAMITGLFRSTSAGTIDPWHLAQNFTSRPELNELFIEENPPLDRIIAVGGAANGQQLLFDCFMDIKSARPMPLYSVPGLIDHL
uniref:Putative major capsid protein n=1 Tax=Gokushovirinae environmental samples TaxID=1478972 RepID=A0A2R3UAF7_9VIRU|nr:putative major capsid protein [Gokushovirinae environmental samples]